MQKRYLFNSGIRLAKRTGVGLLASGMLLLAGCDQGADDTAPVEVVELGGTATPGAGSGDGEQGSSTAASTTAVVTALEDSQAVDVPPDQVNEGQYLLKTGAGKTTLRAVRASRFSILEDFAERADFALEVGGVSDKLVSVDVNDADAGTILSALLPDTAFQLSYRASAGASGYRLDRVDVGLRREQSGAQQSEGAGSGAIVYEPDDSPIFLGSDPGEVELVQRLLSGSEEDRVDAVNELILDPAGLNAAYQVYRSDSSAEVRLAIVEVMEGEETFAAKQLLIEALDDPSPEVALYALGIVDSNSDFSLLPKVRALMQHPDPEVAEYAREVEESIRLSYDDLQ